jgi:Dual-action HEIGH metallo-peptidase
VSGWRTSFLPPLLAAMLLAAPTLRAGEATARRSIVILTPDESDARLAATREAIVFWNGTLSDLKLTPRLHEVELIVASPASRPFEAYTRDIWRLAGRDVPPEAHPKPPPELVALGGDIIVFFSRQRFFSFAWPFAGRDRFFISISTDTAAPLSHPNVSRNVIAHEFGHTLGLQHNGHTRTLMCGPCETLLYRSDSSLFFPLTPEELARLHLLHPGW